MKKKRARFILSDQVKAMLSSLKESDPAALAAIEAGLRAIAENPTEMGARIHTRMSKNLRTELSLCHGLRLKAISGWSAGLTESGRDYDFELEGATLAAFGVSDAHLESFRRPRLEMTLKGVKKVQVGFLITFEAVRGKKLYEVVSQAVSIDIPPEALE